MGRFEREKISKKVHRASQVFAGLAGAGLLVIVLQLFSKTTGFDFFNINYSLSKLFSEESTHNKKRLHAESSALAPYYENLTKQQPDNLEAQIKAAAFLQNNITVTPIRLSPSSGIKDNTEKPLHKFSRIDIASLLTSQDFFTPGTESVYSKNLNQNGILPMVKDVKYSKWSLGISLMPGISFSRVRYTNISEICTRRVGNTQYGFYQTQKERNELNKSLMKYCLALDLSYRFNDKFSLQSGLVYLNTGESVLVKEIAEVNSSQINGGNTSTDNNYFEGNPDFESPKEENSDNNVRFANNLTYFEIPLVLNYRVKTVNNLTSIELQAGMSLTRLDFVTAMVYNFENDGYYLVTGSRPAIYQKYGSNAIVGITINKYITNSIQLFANPQVKIGLTNIFDEGYNIRQHYYNAGIRLGVKINL